MSERTYKIQNIGGSFYLCLPANIVTQLMLKCGVKMTILHTNLESDEAVILIRADINGKYPTSGRASGKDA